MHEVTRSETPGAWEHAVRTRLVSGERFCGVLAREGSEAVSLRAFFDRRGVLEAEELVVERQVGRYPSLTSLTPAAAWYERQVEDLYGLVAAGKEDRESLVTRLRFRAGGELSEALVSGATEETLRDGSFVVPYGPVRSGVFESIQYEVTTSGENVERVRPAVWFKHRGVHARFEGASVADAVLLAERSEGVASVAHALAFSHAVERLVDGGVPVPAGLVRVIHAELERVANHVDSVVRHAEAAGQAVAYANLSLRKEHVQRLRADLCGNRFGRSVVIPGGVTGEPRVDWVDLRRAVDSLARALDQDLRALLETPSFVDRLRGTGTLSLDTVRRFAAVGPVARGSGVTDDVRMLRPYDAYPTLGQVVVEYPSEGDALARQIVRVHEIDASFHTIRQAIEQLAGFSSGQERSWRREISLVDGEAIGWAEAPQGELLYVVELENGVVRTVASRSASFHNLALFPSAFPRDVFTDFAFIEASFGLSIAGVAN